MRRKKQKEPDVPKTHLERADEYAAFAGKGLRGYVVGGALGSGVAQVLAAQQIMATLAVYELLREQIERNEEDEGGEE